MRQRLALGWALIVVLVALILPATTAAATSYGSGYSYKVTSSWCYGQNGPQLAFEVKNTAAGTTDANRLTIDSWSQRRPVGGGSWATVRNWPRVSRDFTVNGSNHSLKLFRQVTYNNSGPWSWRIVMHLRGWHDSSLRASTTVRSLTC